MIRVWIGIEKRKKERKKKKKKTRMPRWSREISYYQKRVIKRVSIVEDYLNLWEEGDLTYDDQGRGASQIELDLLEYCHDQG